MASNEKRTDALLTLTTDIVASHVSNNAVSADQLAAMIEQVYRTLDQVSNGADHSAPAGLVPAVPVKESVTPGYIVCLEDGKRLKMLKRHLMSHFGMTPEEYRTKWGLPADYPMVAPKYADQRRKLAKAIGLGRAKKA